MAARKRAAEKLAKERREWETARDERFQDDMILKDQIEDDCSKRIMNEDGKDIMILSGQYNLVHIWYSIAEYERIVQRLKERIPHLEYDPRIVPGLEYDFRAPRSA